MKTKKEKKFRARKARGAPPKEGSRMQMGHAMGGLFGVTPKKPEPDNAPPTRAITARKSAARMRRLNGKLI